SASRRAPSSPSPSRPSAARATGEGTAPRGEGDVPAYLAEHGRPIRYGYVDEEWPLSAYQTVFSAVPGSAEPPSAARPFTFELVTRLGASGVVIVPITLHCGVASPEDHEPPYAKWFRVPKRTPAAVQDARALGLPIIAYWPTT